MFVLHSEASHQPLTIEIDSDSVTIQKHLSKDDLTVEIGSQATHVDAKKYVLASLQNLLQRERQYKALIGYLESVIAKLWEELFPEL